MRNYLEMALISFFFLVTVISSKCEHHTQSPDVPLVIAAVVEGIGKHPGATSGLHLIYQLAKYKVVAVCSGTLEEKEIVVDHLLVSGDELKSIHVGDKVYLRLGRTLEIPLRFDEEGFRTPSQKVETFYIGHTPELTPPEVCKE